MNSDARNLYRLILTLPALLLFGCSTAETRRVKVVRMQTEYLSQPLAVEAANPRLFWQLQPLSPDARNLSQSAYQILVASAPEALSRDEGDLWDSGKVESSHSVQVKYEGTPLASRRQAFWKVRVWDQDGEVSAWSEVASWRTGLLNESDWKARWISYQDDDSMTASQQNVVLQPARYYRTAFKAPAAIRRATLYATALGIYDLTLNGRKVSDQLFTPGWSDYKKRVYYNAFDATDLVRRGDNAIGAVVADGWYSGYVGYGLLVGYGPNKCGRYFYGKTPALLVQLEIEYADGTTAVVTTDSNWKVNTGPLLEADMLMGETYDARLEMPGWDTAGFDDSGWRSAVPAEQNPSIKAVHHDKAGQREVNLSFEPPAVMQAYPSVPIRPTQTLTPVAITEPTPGVYIYDLGRNFSGVVRLRTHGAEGTRVRLRFGEMLHQNGTLMTENLRKARATNYYILKGDPQGEVYQPLFTYHGFQYVEVTGVTHKPELETITGIVIHSDTPLTSAFACSDPMVNQLFTNVVWTQRANFFEVPTDCPQRDERLGWTGDAQVYAETAAYNADVAAFFTKWFDDLEEAQLPGGAFPDYAPYPMFHGKTAHGYATAWTDAGIICPYAIYKMYGDTQVIERHYEAMRRFMAFRRQRSPDFLGVNICNAWGDWLSLGSNTPIEFIDTVYYAISAQLMSEMAAAIGREQDAAEYGTTYQNIRRAFAGHYLKADGMLTVDNQTACVLSLAAGLIPDEHQPAVQRRLKQLLEENAFRMTTGFLGTKDILRVLSEAGYSDTAARLLQSRNFPSWGYSVVNGATSIWERWNSYTIEEGFGNASMNSFSHYAFGAVCQWMFQELAGINAARPGFKEIRIRPRIPAPGSNPEQEPIHWVSAAYDSIHGGIGVSWKRAERGVEMAVTIPVNTTAQIYVPAQAASQVTESGTPVTEHRDLAVLGQEGAFVKIRAGSGTYRFSVRSE